MANSLPNVILTQGDCLEIMPTLTAGSVDMVMCDLPYGITQNKWDTVIDLVELWEQYKRICTGAIVLTGAQPFTSVLVCSNLKNFKHQWVWDKHIPRGFQTAKYRPMSRHEDVCVFAFYKHTYNPQMILRDKPVTVKNYAKSTQDHGLGKYNTGKSYTYTHRNPDTIIEGCWEANAGKVHPTQKPVALMEYLIKTYTNPGDTVLDNCMGSGTTGVACVNTGRSFIGIEQDAAYFKIASERIAAAQKAKR